MTSLARFAIHMQYSRNFSLISSKSIRHLSNDTKNCLGFEIDAVVELGHRVKSQGLYLIIDTILLEYPRKTAVELPRSI